MFFQFVDVIDDIVDVFSSLLMFLMILYMFFQFVDVLDDIVDGFSSLLMFLMIL